MSNLLCLKDQTAIVTGSSDGIGRAIAQSFLNAGANVVLHGRSSEKLKSLMEEMKQHSDRVDFVVGDITDGQTRTQLIETAINSFGGLNILVNNAGMYGRGDIEQETEKHIVDSMMTNTIAPILLISLATPHLAESKGTIINVSR